MAAMYKVSNLKLVLKHEVDSIHGLVRTWVFNGVVNLVNCSASTTAARTTISFGLTEIIQSEPCEYGLLIRRESAHLLAILSYQDLLKIPIDKIKLALGVDGASHLMALTAGLDSLPIAPPSRAKTLADILLVYPQQGKAILQHANQRRVESSQSNVVIKKITDSLQNMHDLIAPVVDTPTAESVDQLLSSVVDFAAIIDEETPVLQDSNESWPKIADDVRSKVNAAMRTLTQHALSCFGNWVTTSTKAINFFKNYFTDNFRTRYFYLSGRKE